MVKSYFECIKIHNHLSDVKKLGLFAYFCPKFHVSVKQKSFCYCKALCHLVQFTVMVLWVLWQFLWFNGVFFTNTYKKQKRTIGTAL